MEHEKASMLRTEHGHEIELQVVSEGTEILLKTPQFSCHRACAFSKQHNDILEAEQRSKSARKLCGIISLYLLLMVVEIVGGLASNSLSVLTDAAHVLTDVGACGVSLFALWASSWEATSHQSFGFARLEVLGALLSVQLIWLLSGFLIYEAVGRMFHTTTNVNGKLMFITAAFGFCMNFLMMTVLGHEHFHHDFGHGDHSHHDCGHGDHSHHDCGHEDHEHDHEKGEPCAITKEEEEEEKEEDDIHLVSSSKKQAKILNINIQGAYLHVMADMIQSIGVMIAGAVIWAKPEWLVVDLICTLGFAALVVSSTLPILRNIFGILMQRTPGEIDILMLESDLKNIKGVEDIHELHVWTITNGKVVLSCHVEAEHGVNHREILYRIKDYCENEARISHITIQIE